MSAVASGREMAAAMQSIVGGDPRLGPGRQLWPVGQEGR